MRVIDVAGAGRFVAQRIFVDSVLWLRVADRTYRTTLGWWSMQDTTVRTSWEEVVELISWQLKTELHRNRQHPNVSLFPEGWDTWGRFTPQPIANAGALEILDAELAKAPDAL